MDQVKIGGFITTCRKEKELTQNQVAVQLGVTNKAVSKWETGKSLPDVSLLTPLCEILEISLNELLAGEYISDEQLKEKSEEVLKEVVSLKKNASVLSLLSSIFMTVGIVLFFIPVIKDFAITTGIIIICAGVLLLIIGLYGKIRFNQA